jgi:hypothetical protein
MTRIWPQLGLNVSCCATDDLLESDRFGGRYRELCSHQFGVLRYTLGDLS